jgi:hypothetical protein
MFELAPIVLAVFSIAIFLAHTLEAFGDLKIRRRKALYPR